MTWHLRNWLITTWSSTTFAICFSAFDKMEIEEAVRMLDEADAMEPQVVFNATPPFGVLHANRAWEELCGYTAEELQGMLPQNPSSVHLATLTALACTLLLH